MSKPEKTIRIGLVSASIFLNQVESGARERRSVALSRRYRDGEEWKTTTSFGLAELPQAIAVMERAMTYVASLEAETSA